MAGAAGESGVGSVCAFIAGAPHLSPGAAILDSVNPATGEVEGHVAISTAADVDAAVSAGASAQQEWMAMPAGRRSDLIWAWTDRFLTEAESIARADVGDMGKVISDARLDVQKAARFARYWAGMADKLTGDQVPTAPGFLSYTRRDPVGVCGVILPWNGPAIMCVARVALALACGNAVVVKPSELAATSAVMLARVAEGAGLPSGIFNVVPGDRSTGEALVVHPGVAAVNFTGSVSSGRAVAVAAAAHLKQVVLELGGKAPNIVFPDADLDEAVSGATWGVFQNAGQTCCAATRLIVHRSVAGEVTKRVCEMANRVRVGDPMDAASQIGPLVSAAQRARVLDYVASADREGGRVLVGGDAPSDPALRSGFYVRPTVVGNVDPCSRVAQEEIFGPVLTVLEFDDIDEAIAVSNGTGFGLTANVWTTDLSTMLHVAEALDCGVVWGNAAMLMDPALGFGGTKDSGIGKAAGREAIDGMTRTKRVSIRFDSESPIPSWPDL
jgi:acyl-CoA reductase-like NAD-dependent aldehyde dehydrogenase